VSTAAPVVAAAVVPPAALVFVPDPAATGQFTLNATSGSASKSAGPLTLATGATITTDFTFP